eukprot:2289548-Prorocentrum_lima.AAC.1
MTSSLVGSEMCIRDSCRLVRESSVSLPSDTPPQLSPPKIGGVHLLWAVSYTHLTLPTICSV